jgi:hypothetical protein
MLLAFRQNDKGSFSSTFFNKTVDLYQPPVEDSSGGMMRSLLGGLAFMLAAFITFKKVTGATNETVPLRPKGEFSKSSILHRVTTNTQMHVRRHWNFGVGGRIPGPGQERERCQ